tara:strand:+ start:278 stop:520 length:243 start_codon:yes stop_codon:yes gene_type:complete
MNRAKLISQLRSLLGQAEDPHALFAEGAVGQYDNEYSFDLKGHSRSRLISELRYAIGLAENPKSEFAEFELLDAGFCLEF